MLENLIPWRLMSTEDEILRLGGNLPDRTRRGSSVSMWIDETALAEDSD